MDLTEFGPHLLLNPRNTELLPALNICYILFLIIACGFACISCVAIYLKFRNSTRTCRTRVITQRILQPPAYSLRRTEQFQTAEPNSNSNSRLTSPPISTALQDSVQQCNLNLITQRADKYLNSYPQSSTNVPPPPYSEVFPS